MIVDASVLLSAFFPDENQPRAQAVIRDHAVGRVQLAAPSLLLYEMTNAVAQAQRRGRIGAEQAWEILSSFEGLGIELLPVAWQQILPLTQRFGRSAYDAAYLALAESTGRPLVTADLHLYRAVQGHLNNVQWLGEYPL